MTGLMLIVAPLLGAGAVVRPTGAEHEAGAAAAVGVGQRLDGPFAVGDIFPDLAFPSLEDGSPTRLSDFRGRKVMLHVFASW